MIARNGGLSAAADRHGDMADQASGHIENETALAIKAAVSQLHDFRTPQNISPEGQVICSECTGAIAHARLAAMPNATRCRDCEERREEMGLRKGSISFLGPRRQRAQ